MNSNFKKIPSVNLLLENLKHLSNKIDHVYLKKIIEKNINFLKSNPKKYKLDSLSRNEITTNLENLVKTDLDSLIKPVLQRVINGTGIILHTGLGRAPLGIDLLNSLNNISLFTNLEINLNTGKRGQRLDHVIPILQIITGAEDAVITNNNAAATMLCLNSIANRKEVIISRGELVEIGGSFRMPEVMKSSGSKMIEIGATNKTHIEDYENAISDKTAAILLVHPSNFEIKGFTEKPDIKEVVKIAKKHDLPVIYDLGSGALVNMEEYGFYYEPLISEMVDLGIDLISFSGDKLLGGPQSGIVVGKKLYIQKLKKNHLLRALRCDKITIQLLAQTLKSFLHHESLPDKNLTYSFFKRKTADLNKLADAIYCKIKSRLNKHISIVESEGRIGSGAYPTFPVKSISLKIELPDLSAEKISRRFRANEIPILGYIDSNIFYINLLAIHENDIDILVNLINQL